MQNFVFPLHILFCIFIAGVLQPHKWEGTVTLDKSTWGYRRTASYKDILTIEELMTVLAQTISCGGKKWVNI